MDDWFRRIRKAESGPGFVEVKVAAPLPPNALLEVLVADKYCIHIHSGFDPLLLAQVVKSLERLA